MIHSASETQHLARHRSFFDGVRRVPPFLLRLIQSILLRNTCIPSMELCLSLSLLTPAGRLYLSIYACAIISNQCLSLLASYCVAHQLLMQAAHPRYFAPLPEKLHGPFVAVSPINGTFAPELDACFSTCNCCSASD